MSNLRRTSAPPIWRRCASTCPPSSARSPTDEPIRLADVSALLNLRAEDRRRVINTHLAFTEPIIHFVQSLPEGLRRPISSSLRPPVISQAVRGPVDWAATYRARYQQGGNPALFVVRPAERIFDTPENQALLWFLQTLRAPPRGHPAGRVRLLRRNASRGSHGGRTSPSCAGDLEEGLRPRWLAAVSRRARAACPRPAALLRHAPSTPNVARPRSRPCSVHRAPGPEEITELLCQRYFEPRLNWQLFELVVALRLTRPSSSGSARSGRRPASWSGGRTATVRAVRAGGWRRNPVLVPVLARSSRPDPCCARLAGRHALGRAARVPTSSSSDAPGDSWWIRSCSR